MRGGGHESRKQQRSPTWRNPLSEETSAIEVHLPGLNVDLGTSGAESQELDITTVREIYPKRDD